MTHLCELSQKALSGHLAAKSLRDDKTKKFTNVDVTKRQQIVREGQEAERVICKYVDFLMSTENTCNPDKLVSSSFQVISTSLHGSLRVTIQSNLLHTEKSLLDLYAKRDTYECDFPGISNLNFIQLSSSFCKGKLGIA